ncbi:MAG TPA: ImmA/IrrE family metallo-endopeptidase [Rhizomicrobium sp.]|jgi:Zn-dependent peptidase ImmA (M78 family)
MAEQIPITPALVRWGRERAGLSVEAAAQRFARFAAWENGESFPTYSQLEQLADFLKLPVAVFFFPEPPAVPQIRETFRTLPEQEFEQIPSRIRMLLRKAKAFQLNLAELTGGQNPALRLITRQLNPDAAANVEQLAIAVREFIGISVEQQAAWPDIDVALKNWRDALYQVGIFAFKDAFELDEYSGFCLFDEEFPIIYVNNSSTKTRQIFTLFHELAHLIFHTSGVDTLSDEYIPRLQDNGRRIEVLCNRFAAEFLVPTAAFNAAFAGREPTEGTAVYLAARFGVSREVIYRRFLDRDLIDEPTYAEAAQRWRDQREAAGSGAGGGNYYWTKLAYLGRDYVALALSRFHQNRIDESQLADFLDTKPRNVATLEDYFAKGEA